MSMVLTLQQSFDLADKLLACPSFSTPSGRKVVISQLTQRLGVPIPFGSTLDIRMDTLNTINICLNYNHGITEFIGAIRRFDADTTAFKALEAYIKMLGVTVPSEFLESYVKTSEVGLSSNKNLSIFLCHCSTDKGGVRDLYVKLKKDGFRPWLDEEDLLAGQKWELEIPKAIRNSNVVLVCLSQQTVTKVGYVQKEITFALDVAQEHPEETIFLIPAKLEECMIPSRLSHLHWLNLFEENGYEKLLKSLATRLP